MSHNPDSFVDEVSEELRRERMTRLFRRWGWVGLLVVLLIVGGAAWNEWRKARAAAQAQAFGDALSAAQGDADQLQALAITAASDGASADRRAVATLAAASELVGAGDRARAVAVLTDLAADAAIGPAYRDLARLKALGLDPEWPADGERAAVLATLSIPGAPFRPLALEQTALDQFVAGDRDAARATLLGLIEEPGVPPQLRRRADQMLAVLGPAEAP
ncbi:MAG: tetratricopeptide repeat protein [Rhodobacteraceae bacterium]|nr:tetratricopeptide repeat protein [Paracoccaceae bacterium]